MKSAAYLILLLFMVFSDYLGAASRAISPRGPLDAEENTNIRIFNDSSAAVVNIQTIGFARDRFSLNIMEVPKGSGTGFIWDTDGHIVTNYHVIKDGESAQVNLADRSSWKARIVGVAPEKDLAVLKIVAPKEKLKAIPIGTSDDLKVGQKVFAIGNPFGLDHTLTTGIVSALGREIESMTRTPIKNVIQTDAAINPGNSGGPLLDTAGRLVGVNAMIYSPSGAYAGIGFAIPVEEVSWAVPQLISNGKITRPSLGASFIPDRIAYNWDAPGAIVLEVEDGGPAAKAGLRPSRRVSGGGVAIGDIVMEVDGKKVESASALAGKILGYKVNDTITLTILRDRKKMQIKLQLGTAKAEL